MSHTLAKAVVNALDCYLMVSYQLRAPFFFFCFITYIRFLISNSAFSYDFDAVKALIMEKLLEIKLQGD